MRRVLCVLAVAFLAVTAVSAERVSPDDVINMAKQGVGEDVLMAAVERSDDVYNLTAQEILKLKAAGVPDKVIAAMLRKKGTPMPPPMPPPIEKAGELPVVVGAAQGKLNIENVDDLPWAYRLDPNSKILWISKPDAKSQRLLSGHGGVSLSAPAGSYEVRYAGGDASNAFTVVAGQTSLVLVSRVDTQDFEGLYVSIFEQGERKTGGRLAILRQTPRRVATQPRAQPQTTYQYVPAKVTTAQPKTETRVVERYVEPSTTVIYRPAPVYYDPYPYYYGCRPYYYPWNRVHYRYGGCRRSHGWSIGFGIGF